MNEYILITMQNTNNGFVVNANDMNHAITLAKRYVRAGWKIYGIKTENDVYNSDRLMSLIYEN